LLKDFGYWRAQSSEEDFLATLKISDVEFKGGTGQNSF